MINVCQFIGRTGKDPELRYTPSGDAVVTVSLAVSESWKDKSGAKQEKTEWVNLVFWRGLAEVVGKHVKKGDLIYVSGKMQTRSYDDRDGNKRYTTEIVANEMKMLGGGEKSQQDRKPDIAKTAEKIFNDPPFNPDDDVPF
jgi:single-strand DNA-binding protein